MRRVLQVGSWLALAGTIIPSMLFLSGALALDQVKWMMLVSMILWFGVTPFWMERKS